MCYPVQHMLDSAASMASSVTFRGILLRAVSGCCYNNGGLRNRRWANAITKHGGKGEMADFRSKSAMRRSLHNGPLEILGRAEHADLADYYDLFYCLISA